MHYDCIFFIGPQGSGKGTQAKTLADKLGYFMWDMGKVLREHRDAKTVTGETIGEIIDRGQLLTDEQLLAFAEPLIREIPIEKGVIFDGIPRRLKQAEFLFGFLKEQGRAKLATVVLAIPREESLKRLLLRAEKEGRADDTEEAIGFRLDQYEAETVPMLEFMGKNSDYFPLDGRPPIPEVTAEVFKALGIS